jgi:hypothetical protein
MIGWAKITLWESGESVGSKNNSGESMPDAYVAGWVLAHGKEAEDLGALRPISIVHLC